MACEHRGCLCQKAKVERDGKSFCSEMCATAQTENRHRALCPCGHAGCRG
jgi:hypothetical protein